jgi:hydroxyacylglutathione hydrolase
MSQTGPIPSVESTEAERRVREAGEADRPVIVDVRERNEWDEVRIPGAVHVPLSSIADEYTRIPTGRPLILQCASGRRSLVAADFLRRNGYPDVTNMSDGIVGWQKAGLSVERGPE